MPSTWRGEALAQSMRAVRLHGVVPFVGLLASPVAQLDVFAGLTSFVRLQGFTGWQPRLV